MSAADRQRYVVAVRRLRRAEQQLGQEYELLQQGAPGGPTVLQAGRPTADLDGQAVAKLLVQKGLVTKDEVEAALADAAEAEVARIAAALGVGLP